MASPDVDHQTVESQAELADELTSPLTFVDGHDVEAQTEHRVRVPIGRAHEDMAKGRRLKPPPSSYTGTAEDWQQLSAKQRGAIQKQAKRAAKRAEAVAAVADAHQPLLPVGGASQEGRRLDHAAQGTQAGPGRAREARECVAACNRLSLRARSLTESYVTHRY